MASGSSPRTALTSTPPPGWPCSTIASQRVGGSFRRTAWPPTFRGSGRRASTMRSTIERCFREELLKAAAYEECFQAVVAIWRDEGGATLDDIALMATINSILAHRFTHFYWTGFYRVCGDRLVIGPYIGTVGCLQIDFARGVCGTAAEKRQTLIVPDVN